MSRILVVDDMEFNRHHLRKVLESEGFEVDTVGDGRSAWNQLRAQRYDLVITDLRMPDLSGLELLAKVRAERLPVGVIVLTAFGDPAEALRAMKAGADDFVAKPYEPDHLRLLIKRILDRRQLIDELEQLRKQMRGDYHFHTMVSKSPKIRKLFDLIEQVGPIGSTVLIQGETGTGKELVAQAVHAADTRRAGPFVALNCAVLNDSLLESELFGHEKGSFTGAERRKIGRFEMADGGTLLLDEIGDIPAGLQAKLLRVLQSGTFERVGGTESIQRRRADRGGHSPDPRRRSQEGPLPRRLVLPAQRDPDRPAPAARANRGYPAPGDAFPREAPFSKGHAGHRDGHGRHAGPLASQLAGQCPGAGKRDQGGDRPGGRIGPAPRRPAGIGRAANAHTPRVELAARRRTLAARFDLRLDRAGRARVFRPLAVAIQGKRRPLRPPQRLVAAQRDAEATEIRSGASRVQEPRAGRARSTGRTGADQVVTAR